MILAQAVFVPADITLTMQAGTIVVAGGEYVECSMLIKP